MTRRTKIIILIVLLLLALLLLLWLLFGLRRAVAPEPAFEPGTRPLPEAEQQPTVEEEKPNVEQEARVQSASVQSLSKTFTERYGSFSSESEFANLRDVMVLMTQAFAAQTQAYMDTAVAPTEFYSVTTHVVSLEVEVLDETAGFAAVRVQTQREEAVDEPQNVSVRYQTILLELKRESGEWKVDSATWL